MCPGSKTQSTAKQYWRMRVSGSLHSDWEGVLQGKGEAAAVAAGDTSGPAFVKINAFLQILKEKLGTWDL